MNVVRGRQLISRSLLVLAVTAGAWGCAGGPSRWHRPSAGELWREPSTGIEFVWIRPGCFLMGQGDEERESIVALIGAERYRLWYSRGETPRHEVCVDGFWMARHEVTNAQYRVFAPAHKSGRHFGESLEADDLPAVDVSWNDATAFTGWLARRTDLPVRLPTEAEWEYAARGGTASSRHWGDDPDDGCRYENLLDVTGVRTIRIASGWRHRCDDAYGVAAPVGRFLPNPFGLHDMLGNVQEWCSDWFYPDYYAVSPREDPRGPQAGTHRSVRGGSWWMTFPGLARSAGRYRLRPEESMRTLGFRPVVSGRP